MAKVYALIVNGLVTRIEGQYTLPDDLEGWTLIEEGEPCDRLNLAQTHYLPKGLFTADGIAQYKYYRKAIKERSEAEIEADRAALAIVPTQLDAIEAQVLYTALMTNTILEA